MGVRFGNWERAAVMIGSAHFMREPCSYAPNISTAAMRYAIIDIIMSCSIAITDISSARLVSRERLRNSSARLW